MKFRTEIKIPEGNKKIGYQSQIVLYGSCFTENIEKKLSYYKFRNFSNSHGILFNPKAIEKAVDDCIRQKVYQKNDLYYFNDLWLSFYHHTKFSSPDADEALLRINSEIENAHESLKKATHIIITLGTSWIYHYKKEDIPVANCHKIPQKEYRRTLLNTEEVNQILRSVISKLHTFNPEIQIIFTVSPVRHLKDGFMENSLSKAILLTAIHQLTDNRKISYFPSYEIMMDDLRDYRFYKNDMIHPNDTAVNYIWKLFKNSWIEKKEHHLMKEIDAVQRSLMHKPFNPESEQHQEFVIKLDNKIRKLQKQYPFLNFYKKQKKF